MAKPSSPSTNPVTAAAQDEMGAMMHTGAAVASMRYASFARETVELIRHRPHDAAHCQAVEIVIDEDQ